MTTKLPSWLQKIFVGVGVAVSAATLIGVGKAAMAQSGVDAVQNRRIEALEKNTEAVKDLSAKLDTVNENLTVVKTQLEERTSRDPRN